jgi:putative ABC transport system ATP-binding protein
MAESLIKTEGLMKEYWMGEVPLLAVRGVSVEIARGELVAIMGPSGSGKSTFMNLLGCLDSPTAGRYLLAGEDVSRLDRDALARTRNRRIGFVFQHFNLLPRMTAIENVELPLIYAGVPAAVRRTKALSRLREVGLAGRAYHQPSQMSGGEQQRVAIARALANDPILILADEPTGALDTRTSVEVMGLFQQLNDKGITIVVVTHEADVAAFTRRILSFRDGRLVGDSPVAVPRRAADVLAQLAPVGSAA